jgi:CRP-like cAMP-binding protein
MQGFLAALEEGDAAALRAAATERRYARGTAVFHQGDDSKSVLLVVEGRVKIVLLGPDGRELIAGFAGPGDILGELAAIANAPRSSSVYALEPVRALAVPGTVFEQLLLTRPRFAWAVLRNVASRLEVADAQRLELATLDVLGRVARGLLELSERFGEATDGGVVITLPLSQDELAAWTGASREGVAKALQLLRGLGWVETARRRTVVLDRRALQAYVRGARFL